MSSVFRDQVTFERIVQKILESNGFTTDLDYAQGSARLISSPDLVMFKDQEKYLVETKFYRTTQGQLGLLDAAVQNLVADAKRFPNSHLILATSAYVPHHHQISIREKYDVIIYDRLILDELCAGLPNVSSQLNSLFEFDYLSLTEKRLLSGTTTYRVNRKNGPIEDPPKALSKGSTLIERLDQLPPGKTSAQNYEKLCMEILKHLFENSLTGWHPQKTTTDGLNRFDYICRIKQTQEFWNFLLHHLNSRYIVFEFKNHTTKLDQKQIISTDKYLFEKALRKVALVFSRKGASTSAQKAAQGIMRDSGKLIFVLADEDIREMLTMKDKGEDPSDYLFNRVDEFFLTLSK